MFNCEFEMVNKIGEHFIAQHVGGDVPTVDWTIYHFSHPIDLSGILENINGYAALSHLQNK